MNIVLLFIIILVIIIILVYNIIMNNSDLNKKIYYFDNNATTYIYDSMILKEINNWINCGNPSNSLHSEGIKAKLKLEESRQIVANDLQVSPDEIYFTSGSTESNDIIINRIVTNYLEQNDKCSIITSNIEHPSILNIFEHYKKNLNVNVIIIPVVTDKNNQYYGTVDPKTLENEIIKAENVLLMSLMYANNETGIIQDIINFGKLAKKYNIFFHTDATQAIGKMNIHPNKLNIHSMSFSGHKFHTPKGVGCLYIKQNCKMLDNTSQKICSKFGTNSQEFGVRGGTENIAYISAFALGLQKTHEDRNVKNKQLYRFKKDIIENLQKLNCTIIESNNNKNMLPNTILVILNNINTCNIVFAKQLSKKYNICIGISSACQSGKESHIIKALKIPIESRNKIIRISMSDYNTAEEVDYLIKSITKLLSFYRPK